MVVLGAWRLRNGDKSWIGYFFVLLGVLNFAGAVQHVSSKIVLLRDRLEFGTAFGRTTVQKEEIESVTWEAGCGVSLRTKAHAWIRVPDLGRAQGVCNSVRAWLKK
jgi:hypothetical protein